MSAYKVLDENLRSTHGGSAQWVVGERMEVEGDLVPCENGIHICRNERDLLSWLGPVICECEHSDEYVDSDNKRVCRWAIISKPNPHWTPRAQQHFTADCAEYALQYADESHAVLLQSCIDIARAYADWPEDWEAERAAAYAAARAAAYAATDAAACAAARAAAYAATDAAAGAAACAAACAAARSDLAAILATYLDGRSEWV